MKYFATNILPSRVARTVGVRHCPVYILVIHIFSITYVSVHLQHAGQASCLALRCAALRAVSDVNTA